MHPLLRAPLLQQPKGLSKSEDIRGKKALCLCLLDFPRALWALWTRAETKRAKKAGKGRLPGKEARHPLRLQPPFVTLDVSNRVVRITDRTILIR